MDNRFEITEKMMENAATYMPILLKETICNDWARACVKSTDTVDFYEREDGEKPEGVYSPAGPEYALPPVYVEDATKKARILLSILMTFYLKAWGDEKGIPCSHDEYDSIMGSHVLNQLERFKANANYREKAFDILADYHDLEKRMNSAIYAVCREANDPISRLVACMSTLASKEFIDNAMKMIEESQQGIERERERQMEIIKGGEDGE